MRRSGRYGGTQEEGTQGIEAGRGWGFLDLGLDAADAQDADEGLDIGGEERLGDSKIEDEGGVGLRLPRFRSGSWSRKYPNAFPSDSKGT